MEARDGHREHPKGGVAGVDLEREAGTLLRCAGEPIPERDRIIRSLLLAFDGLNRRLLHVMSKDPVPEDERLNQASTEAAYAEMKADYVS